MLIKNDRKRDSERLSWKSERRKKEEINTINRYRTERNKERERKDTESIITKKELEAEKEV